ncbi:alpha/beta hydrolase [Microseira wollei]|uniref:Phospholipase/Carboxylesterase n=1 Tax=Microseira wollei NIES-4236 TaxID=2530354 RepID=A0AAV3X7Y0_9CYAN|nr:alpha/beta fold hydrolase [Microseira wollei]GET36337.1 phospholipase/Carboxylesterase [Microseira wollei NIES-4236]
MLKTWRKGLLRLGKMSALAYTSTCGILFFSQPYFIFKPTRTFPKNPEFYNIKYQNVYLPVPGSSSNDVIHGWWIPSQRRNLGTLLYLHGNSFNIGSNITQAYRFHQLGFSVLLIDYRGYGKSQGNFPSESQVYQDAQIAWNYLVKQKQIPANQIFIYGHSLGGAVAIDLAVKHPEAAGLIVQNSFTSMQKMAELDPYLRIFPISLILRHRFDSITKVKSLRMPVLFVHGTADAMIPKTMSKTLYAAAPEPKQLLLVPGAKHNNGDLFFNRSEYRQAIQNFAASARNGR